MDVTAARQELEANGYVVVEAAGYRRAQERQRVAEALLRAAEERIESVERWARECATNERKVSDRLVEIVAFAMERGRCTYADLAKWDDRP